MKQRLASNHHYSWLMMATILLLSIGIDQSNAASEQPTRPLFRTRTSRQQQQQQQQSQPQSQSQTGTGSVVEVPAPPVNKPAPSVTQVSAPAASNSVPNPVPALALASASVTALAASQVSQTNNNRTVRTASDIFQNGDGYNIFVTNTCERDSMKVNIKTSRPFYGVIHTRNQRDKQICTVEGNGDTDYNLEISHVLNQKDPNYCGVIKARRESVESKDTLSVVVAVRVHRNIELSDDKFFLLNCTNRCQKADCSSPSAKLVETEDSPSGETERETSTTGTRNNNKQEDECTIWKFPWAITLLWCMGILLLAMLISHCILCSSMVCKKVRTEIEEREPSVYEGATDYDDDELYNKRHPYRIDYDNKDIYKTSNNYEPYKLKENQTKNTSRRSKYSNNNK